MTKKAAYHPVLGRLILGLTLMFALSSCSAKESFLGSFDIDFQRPLHKTLSTSTFSETCHSATFEDFQLVKTTKFQTLKLAVTRTPSILTNFDMERTPNMPVSYSKITSGLSPPFYILYNCLKLDITTAII